MTASGRFGIFTGRISEPAAIAGGTPLVVAIHGGTYTSAYFDVPGQSLLHCAERNGIRAIAIDRYGYGGTPFIEDMTIHGQASQLRKALGEVWAEQGGGTRGVVLIGHSIGAAIALGVASERGSFPMLGLAVSGIGVRTPGDHAGMWNSLPDTLIVEMPGPIKDQLMFGPLASYSDAMPAASHVADAPVPKAELVDIVGGWQTHADAICGKVRTPVHYRQAEQDRLWIVNQGEIEAFARRFTASPRVDAAMVSNTGHCMDFHKISLALHLQQLGFAVQCAVDEQA